MSSLMSKFKDFTHETWQHMNFFESIFNAFCAEYLVIHVYGSKL